MGDISVKSEITGTVWKIETEVGQQVAEDDVVMILESMKMEIPVMAPQNGKLKSITVNEGDSVSEGQEVAVMED